MGVIETEPCFAGRFEGFGHHTFDSVVGALNPETANQQFVLKWNRARFPSSEAAFRAARYLQKSVFLYSSVLGEEYVVPTNCVVGRKVDNGNRKHKVFVVQPFIPGVATCDLPESLLETAQNDWNILAPRVAKLYSAADQVVQEFKELDRPFFRVKMTLGDSRDRLRQRQVLNNLPRTPNMFFDPTKSRLQLFDYGPYTEWKPEMEESYQRILELCGEQ